MANKAYVVAELKCSALRVAFVDAMATMRQLDPKCASNRRSDAVQLDKYLQRFCNRMRQLAAEKDQTT